MRIKIIRQPKGIVDGMSMDHYQPGRVYDVATAVANYLVAERWAIFERREGDEATSPKNPQNP